MDILTEKLAAHKNQLRLVAWEATRECNLNCVHCRARAFESTGDFLAEEPLCAYQPSKKAAYG